MVEPLETLVFANPGVSSWPGLSSSLGLRPWASLLPLPHFKIKKFHSVLQPSSEIQSGRGIAVAEIARGGLVFTLIREKKNTTGILLGFLNSMGQFYFDSHQLLFFFPCSKSASSSLLQVLRHPAGPGQKAGGQEKHFLPPRLRGLRALVPILPCPGGPPGPREGPSSPAAPVSRALVGTNP